MGSFSETLIDPKILMVGNTPKLNETKMTTQNVKRRCKRHSKYKRRNGWTNLNKTETDCNIVFF